MTGQSWPTDDTLFPTAVVKDWKCIYKCDFPEINCLKQLCHLSNFPFRETFVGRDLLVATEDFFLQDKTYKHKLFKDYSIIKSLLLELVKQAILPMEEK